MGDFLDTGDLRHESATAFLDAGGGMGSFRLHAPAPMVPREHVSQRFLFTKSSKRYCLINRSRYSRYVDVVSAWAGTPLFTRLPIIDDMSPEESTA